MSKHRGGSGGGNPSGGGGGMLSKIPWSELAETLIEALAAGGYSIAGDPEVPGAMPQNGVWLAMGEPNSGSPTIQQTGVMWGGAAYRTQTVGTVIQSIMIESPRLQLQQSAAPMIQGLEIRCLDGQVDLGAVCNADNSSPTPLPALFLYGQTVFSLSVAVGMYVADWNNVTSLYNVQDPGNPVDVSRFDWIYLEQRTLRFITGTQVSQSGVVSTSYAADVQGSNQHTKPSIFDLYNPKLKIKINSGQALILAVSVGLPVVQTLNPFINGTAATFTWYPAIRGFLVRG